MKNRSLRRYCNTKSSKAAYRAVITAKADERYLDGLWISYGQFVHSDLAEIMEYIHDNARSIRDEIAKIAILISGDFVNGQFMMPPTRVVMKNWPLVAQTMLIGDKSELDIWIWDEEEDDYIPFPIPEEEEQ